jgi:hypothetical protein
LNRRIQSTEPSGATSSPSAQGRARRILEDAIRARGVVCVVFVVTLSLSDLCDRC